MKPEKSKYSQKSGFKVPENYFGSLEEKMMQKIQEQDAAKLPVKENAFLVPDGYFDSLEDKIIAKVNNGKPRVISLIKKEYLFYAAAVAAIFVLMLGNFFNTGSQEPMGWDDIEISAMENYIDDGYDMGYIELNTSDYSDFILTGNQLIDEEDFSSVNSDAVFDYIDENIEDPTYILE